jgi:hypothetical protein
VNKELGLVPYSPVTWKKKRRGEREEGKNGPTDADLTSHNTPPLSPFHIKGQ